VLCRPPCSDRVDVRGQGGRDISRCSEVINMPSRLPYKKGTARMHSTPAELAAIPAPADAQYVQDWRDDFDTGDYDRYFRGTRRHVAGVDLHVTGFQAADGAASRDVHVFAVDVQLDPAALRKLAVAALDAADEVDRLAG
jgi:hypothetical protein